MAAKGQNKGPDPKWVQKRDEFLKATADLHRLRADLAKLETELVRRGAMNVADSVMMW